MTRRTRIRLLVVLFTAVTFPLSGEAFGQSAEPIRYIVSFPAPQTHYAVVEASVPAAGQASIELMMPVWTPGSYLVREYSKNVEAVAARSEDGRPLPVSKTAKNRWRVPTNGGSRIAVTYRVYSREMTVRNNWVDADFAMLNGAATFMTLVERGPRVHEVTMQLPPAWKTSITGMPDAPGGAPNHYRAVDFDTLVDSPIVAGNPTVFRIDVAGKPHFLVNVGDEGLWDVARSVGAIKQIVETNLKMWGSLPYDKYVFFNVLTGGGGGIEHRNSVMMMASRWSTTTEQGTLAWLGLVSHEYFHLWNVKRLRPVELGPFDYEHEVYTRSLWIAEGLTDYYGDVLLKRAGLVTEARYLAQLSEAIRSLQTTPGRLVQPVELASFDAWIKEYRRDENSPNVSISYYTKGAVIGFLLDAKIQQATRGTKSLDDVMRLAFQRYSGERGFRPDEFRAAASEIAGQDLGPWFIKVLETTEELEYTEALDWFKLRFAPAAPAPVDAPGWLGARTRIDAGRLVITEVRRGTPAYEAGINVDDELVAINGFRFAPDQLDARLRSYRPGNKVQVLVSRRDRLRQIDVTLGVAPRDAWELQRR